MRTKFTGLGTALVTPFTKSGAMDEKAVRRLGRRQIDNGTHFLVPVGTTGENPTLEVAERLRMIEILADEAKGQVPVLAPYCWLREADPLPHSWEVTSDSLAAWIAGALGAARLAIVKPPGARGGELVDRAFFRILPATVSVEIVAADELDRLGTFLRTLASTGT
jgi:hypothetical protein